MKANRATQKNLVVLQLLLTWVISFHSSSLLFCKVSSSLMGIMTISLTSHQCPSTAISTIPGNSLSNPLSIFSPFAQIFYFCSLILRNLQDNNGFCWNWGFRFDKVHILFESCNFVVKLTWFYSSKIVSFLVELVKIQSGS